MLQTHLQRPAGEEISSENTMSSYQAILMVRAIVARQYPLMIFILLFTVALVSVYAFTAPRRYTSTAELIIDSRKAQIIQQQQANSTPDVPIDTSMVDSQVEILKSETIALDVIKDLHLTSDPEFSGSGGGLFGSLTQLLTAFVPNTPRSEYQITRGALARFQKGLTVRRRNLTYIIEISFESLSAERAAQVANAIAEAYIVGTLESKYQASRRAASWLQDRMKELRAQASIAERAVVDFKAKNNIVDAGGRSLTEQQLAEINSTLTVARAQRAEADARLQRITSILKNENGESQTLIDDVATVADTLKNDVITRLRQQYLDLAARAGDWSNRYGANHLAVVNLHNQMRQISRSIADELRRIAETYKSDLEIAQARENSSLKSLNDTIAVSNETSGAQITLRDLESNSQSARALADNFLQLYMFSVQQQSFPITEARVITEAAVRDTASSPKLPLIFLAALVGGTILAGLAALLRDLMDRVFRTAPQVEKALGFSCLAITPMVTDEMSDSGLKGSAKTKLRGWWTSRRLRNGGSTRVPAANSKRADSDHGGEPSAAQNRQLSVTSSIASIISDAPFSRFAESMRAIKMAVDLVGYDTANKVIGLTSSLPNEGKSTLSEALAQTCAQGGVRTLLIDGDLRNPSLTARLTPSAKIGLLELALGQTDLKSVVWTDPKTNLDFLPCALPGRFSNSADLLSSPQMEKLFRQFREQYDRIIVDMSPLAPVIDVRGTSRLIDSYILVIEWAQTKIDIVERALNETPVVHQRILGAILNKVDLAAMSRYDYYRGNSYYNNAYYHRYGYVD